LNRTRVVELQYITPLANVRSIIQRGILSHVRAEPLKPVSVAAEEIQDRRAKVQVPGGRPLHQYANLYFHGRNPMLYKRLSQHNDLCVLRVSPDVLDIPDTVIADANASSKYVRFGPSPAALTNVDEELTYAEDWTSSDEIVGFRRKSAKCAEVLVPDTVPSRFIVGAYLSCAMSMQTFRDLAVAIPGQLNAHLFFLA
jgi:hypothetical protein